MNKRALAWSDGAAGPLLADPEPDLTWQDAAACQYVDPELFFPKKGGSVRDAKKVCTGCPVRQPCLEFALGNDERFGIFGGKSERERRRISRDRARAGDSRLCRRGRHRMTPENVSDEGTCIACSPSAARRRDGLGEAA